MDPYYSRLKEAHQLLLDYRSNETIRNDVNTTFRYKNRNVFLYIQLLTSFSPTYLTYYNVSFARSSDTLGHRVSPYQLLPTQVGDFLGKCYDASNIRERLFISVTDQSPEKKPMTPEEYRRQLQQQYDQEQQQLGLPIVPSFPKPKVGPEGDNTQTETDKLKDEIAIKKLRADLDTLIQSYTSNGSFNEAELGEFPLPSSYLEALIAEGLLNKPDDPEQLKQWEERLQQLAEKIHKGEYKVDQEKYQEAKAKLSKPSLPPTTTAAPSPSTLPVSQPPRVRRQLTPADRLRADANRATKRIRTLLTSKPKASPIPPQPSPSVQPKVGPPTPVVSAPTIVQNTASQAGIAIQKATRKPNVLTGLVGGLIGGAVGGVTGGLSGALTGLVAGAVTGGVAPTIIQQLTTNNTIIQSQPEEQQQQQIEEAFQPPSPSQGPGVPPPNLPKIPFFKKYWFWFIIILALIFLLPIILSIFKTSSLCPPWDRSCGQTVSNPAPLITGEYSLELTKSGQEKVDNRQQITYELTITLKGPGSAEVEVSDIIPSNATFIKGDESPTLQGNKLIWKIPRLGPAQPKKLTFAIEPRNGETWNDDVWVVNQAEARIIRIFADGTNTSPGSVSGAGCPDTSSNKSADSCKYLNPSINIFDTEISQAGIEAYVKAYAPRFINAGKGDEAEFRRRVDYIIKKSKEASLNPAIALGLWKSENAFGTTGSREMGCAGVGFYEEVHCALGIEEFSNPVKNPIPNCARSKDANSSACKALKELRAKEYERIKPISYPVATFDDFMEAHGPYGHFTGGQPTNCMHSYNVILEVAKEVGACKLASSSPATGNPQPFPQNPGNLGVTVSCPLGASGYHLSCGTAANPTSNCGHGGIGYAATCNPYYYACNGSRYSDALYKSIDIVSTGASGPVFMPFVNGNQKVAWKLIQGPISIGGGAEWGYKVVYETDFNGKKIRLDFTHLNGLQPPGTIFSGEQLGTYTAKVAHLHSAVSIDGTWVEPKDVQMCTQ